MGRASLYAAFHCYCSHKNLYNYLYKKQCFCSKETALRVNIGNMKRSLASGTPVLKKKGKVEEDFNLYLSPNEIYYRHPISCREANKFNNNSRKKPIDLLNELRSDRMVDDPQVFIHWFRSDLRLLDNTSLSETVKKFSKHVKQNRSCRLLTVFAINEHDWRAHLDSGWKLSFMLNALSSLQKELAKLSIPFHILKYEPEKPLLSNSHDFVEWFKTQCSSLSEGSKSVSVSANAEYESDELYRDIKLLNQRDSAFEFEVHHDSCALEPCLLKTGKGSTYTLFTPWYKKWAAEVESRIKAAKSSYILKLPELPQLGDYFKPVKFDYDLPAEFTNYIPIVADKLPEASESAAAALLSKFLEKKVESYDVKDILIDEGSSHLSCYLSLGIVSSRNIIYESYNKSPGGLMSKDIKKNTSLQEFVREVAWRDFYKNAICSWPFLTMDLPFRFELNDLKWKGDEETFKKWCLGKTGVPIVDAIMRKLLNTGYINNRARMIVASFLSKNLLLDWRWGERWFRKHLIDFDLASNIGGWGFCSSTGIDAQPYFRVFNMELQSKRYDSDGHFIKKWVPELKGCSDVHSVLSKRGGYPDPLVDLKESRNEALAAYREVL